MVPPPWRGARSLLRLNVTSNSKSKAGSWLWSLALVVVIIIIIIIIIIMIIIMIILFIWSSDSCLGSCNILPQCHSIYLVFVLESGVKSPEDSIAIIDFLHCVQFEIIFGHAEKKVQVQIQETFLLTYAYQRAQGLRCSYNCTYYEHLHISLITYYKFIMP